LIPYSNGRIWYWHENESQSFWYPSLKIFRQDNLRTWQQPIQDCSEWIKGLL
jgi:DNA/RNA endonuclease G (NUC1)